jgi:hypothetical protein
VSANLASLERTTEEATLQSATHSVEQH